MALGDVLAARAANARARQTAEIGALGTVTLEALPLRELEQCMRGADSDRAVFYAACRELQSAGAALLQAGKVYRPDEAAALVSDAEAAKAAEVVRALSGWTGGASPAPGTENASSAVGVTMDIGEADAGTSGQVSRETEEIRRPVVQLETVRRDGVQDEIRRGTVQDRTAFEEIRHDSVQLKNGDGQVSREFLDADAAQRDVEREPQEMSAHSPEEPQNVVVVSKSDSNLAQFEAENAKFSSTGTEKFPPDLHESKSENGENLHEVTSESGGKSGHAVHETTSESARKLHEMKSELGQNAGHNLHEIESDLDGKRAKSVHEIRSESGNGLHEIESETARGMHETESELAERVARGLLEGLRRAAWVQ